MIKLVATDLDGTFLNDDKSISPENIEALEILGRNNVVRVIATGRNLQKTKEVIPDYIPFDFIVFSSGAGVISWPSQQLIFRQNMDRHMVHDLARYLASENLSFHLFKAVPDNHECWYYKEGEVNEEFDRYFVFHLENSEEIFLSKLPDQDASQFLVIFPNDVLFFNEMKRKIEALFKDVKVLRTSSPLNTGYIWMEIFHKSVSKGNGVQFVCDHQEIGHHHTLGIGNDFNDIDLLNFTNISYVVDNGPGEMKNKFLVGKSNAESAFAHIINQYV